MLEHILSHEECDVDPVNRLEKATPLHLALRIQDKETRTSAVESLLEAGADTTCVFPPPALPSCILTGRVHRGLQNQGQARGDRIRSVARR